MVASIISSGTIDGYHISLSYINNVKRLPDFDSRLNNSPTVNMTHNQSVYQCTFTFTCEGGLNTVMSSVGTMTVVSRQDAIHMGIVIASTNKL